ncbi:hypothetical protein HZS_1018, partial [Henneguya salminicola]
QLIIPIVGNLPIKNPNQNKKETISRKIISTPLKQKLTEEIDLTPVEIHQVNEYIIKELNIPFLPQVTLFINFSQISIKYLNFWKFIRPRLEAPKEMTIYDKAMIECYVNMLRINASSTDGVRLKALQNAISSSKSCADAPSNTDSDKINFSNSTEGATSNIDTDSNVAENDNKNKSREENINYGANLNEMGEASNSIPNSSATVMATKSNNAANIEKNDDSGTDTTADSSEDAKSINSESKNPITPSAEFEQIFSNENGSVNSETIISNTNIFQNFDNNSNPKVEEHDHSDRNDNADVESTVAKITQLNIIHKSIHHGKASFNFRETNDNCFTFIFDDKFYFASHLNNYK